MIGTRSDPERVVVLDCPTSPLGIADVSDIKTSQRVGGRSSVQQPLRFVVHKCGHAT
jgi:hypothetical protein